MASNAGTLEQLILEVAKTLEPLKDLSGVTLFARLGLPLPRSISGNSGISNHLSTVTTTAGDLGPGISSLATAIEGEDIATIISSGADLISSVATLIEAIK